ncbi:MAG: ABC transporter permease subunit [Verrucomicrobia bacterium]|nr:ABC transporter permease subunit [Verrucomicrobiota bacterium]
MTFLPVVERELRVAARHRSAFWVRLVSAGGAVLCAFASFLIVWPPFGSAMQSGRELFLPLGWLAFCLCVVAGPIFTCDTISAEKREGTLGLLFLTNLHGMDVVLGKLVAASVTSVFALLAVLPVMAIPILLGGVQLGDLVRVALVLGNTLFLSLSVGILMSALCVQWRSALALTGFVLFLMVFVATAMAADSSALNTENLLQLAAHMISPVRAMVAAWNSQLAPVAFWASVVSTHAMAWVALAVAGWVTARAWREPSGWVGRTVRRRFWYDWYYGSPEARGRLRALMDKDPIAWLRWRPRLKRWLLWGAVAAALAFWVLIVVSYRYSYFARGDAAVFLVGIWLLGPIKWLAASEATHQLATEVQSGALELLLTTPISVREIVRGHLRAMDWLLMVPASAVLVVQVGMIILNETSAVVFMHGEPTSGMAIVGIVTALWDIRTIEWVGMWLSVKKRRADRAFAGTVRRILFLPWFVLLALLMGSAFIYQNRPSPPMVWENIPVVWFIICACTNLYFGLTARHNLLERFRLMASERYQTR